MHQDPGPPSEALDHFLRTLAVQPSGSAQMIGAKLRELRKAAGTTGLLVAAQCGISNSRLSRIERGESVPRAEEVAAVMAALGCKGEEVKRLVALANGLRSSREGWRDGWSGPDAFQDLRSFAKWRESVRHVLWFEPLAIPGVLQTPEYARSLFDPDGDWTEILDIELDASIIDELLALRLREQMRLFDLERRYEFVLLESSFRCSPVSPTVVQGQIFRVATAVTQPNVRIGVIPSTTRLPTLALSNFSVSDGQIAEMEPGAGAIYSTSPTNVTMLTRLFRRLDAVALHDEQAVEFLQALARDVGDEPMVDLTEEVRTAKD